MYSHFCLHFFSNKFYYFCIYINLHAPVVLFYFSNKYFSFFIHPGGVLAGMNNAQLSKIYVFVIPDFTETRFVVCEDEEKSRF